MNGIPPTAILIGGIAALLLIAAATLAVTKKLKLPFTVMLVIVGLLLRWMGNVAPEPFSTFTRFEISPDLIFFVFLPTLIFESAFNMDVRQLKHNLGEVMMLAIPGLLISTAVIGGIITLFTDIPLAAACLLGAILSATDPVAVISLFKQLGAPKRLTILVEGESLFNDASSMVVAKVLLGIVLAGTVSATDISNGIFSFFILFLGGVFVGWLMGLITGWLLGRIESDPLLEITLTTVLAYLSFLIAEELLHVSGIMATMAAGITLGGWGRYKISPLVREYLENFWEYLVFVANALIFLMVGLRIGDYSLWDERVLLGIALLAMLLSRAIVIFGLLPAVGKYMGEEKVQLPYLGVMFWGGLRGAIAIAIVLSLADQGIVWHNQFAVVVMGCVLFTLLVQGLTIKPLMCKLGLDIPPLPDRLARAETSLLARKMTISRINELMSSGLFLLPVAERLKEEIIKESAKIKNNIEHLHQNELTDQQELNLLYLQTFSEERALYIDMLNKGHLSEAAFRDLVMVLDMQCDRIRYQGRFLSVRWGKMKRRELINKALHLFERMPVLCNITEKIRLARVAMNYEQSWGHFMSSRHALQSLKKHAENGTEILIEQYQRWHDIAEKQLDQMAEQFPEFFAAMQERLGQRLGLLAEAEAAEERSEHGVLPRELAEAIRHDVAEKLRELRGFEVEKLKVEPEELLRKVPCFEHIDINEFERLAARMKCHTLASGEIVIKQGDTGHSLYLIARGVVRVLRNDSNNIEHSLATLIAGDFFGEMALLHAEPRNATVRMVTPGTLYELRREDLDAAIAVHPELREALENADGTRRIELNNK